VDETVKFDEVVDDDIFDFFPVDKGPVFVDVVEVLHEDEDFDLEFVLVLDEGVLNDDFSLGGCEFNFLLLIFLVCVIDRTDRGIVNQIRFVNKWRGFHNSVDLNGSGN
jgi:hypothetical protein